MPINPNRGRCTFAYLRLLQILPVQNGGQLQLKSYGTEVQMPPTKQGFGLHLSMSVTK